MTIWKTHPSLESSFEIPSLGAQTIFFEKYWFLISKKSDFLEDFENAKWTTLKNIWFDVPGTLAFWSLLEHAPMTNLIQLLGVFLEVVFSRSYLEDVQGLRWSRKFCDVRYVTNFMLFVTLFMQTWNYFRHQCIWDTVSHNHRVYF